MTPAQKQPDTTAASRDRRQLPLQAGIIDHLRHSQAKDGYTATAWDRFVSLALTVRDRLVDQWMATQQQYYDRDVKRVYYLSLEFMMGRSLGENLINLDMADEARLAAAALGCELE